MLIAFCLAGFYLWPLADRLVERSRQSGGIASDLRPLFDSISPPGETSDSAAGHPVRYCLESVALGSAAVVAAQQGLLVGLPRLACACLAITIAFGGAARDVLCQREIRLMDADGSQSYAVSSFVGALVYVSLRELRLELLGQQCDAPQRRHSGQLPHRPQHLQRVWCEVARVAASEGGRFVLDDGGGAAEE